MNEADTRATLIEPKLKAAGWTDRLVTREYYYQRDQQYAPGRIILVGDQVRRGTALPEESITSCGRQRDSPLPQWRRRRTRNRLRLGWSKRNAMRKSSD